MNFRKQLDALSTRWSLLTWGLVAVVSFWYLGNIRLEDGRWKTVIGSDGTGYYAFLPATFIYHDLEYNFCKPGSKTNPGSYGSSQELFMARTNSGKLTNKYFIGTAVMEAPFFFAAHLLESGDGYSYRYQLFVCFAAITWLLLALWWLRKLLRELGLRDGAVAATLALVFFGTHLFHYTLEEPAMSHVYSFAMVAFLLLHAYRFFVSGANKNFVAAAIAIVLLLFIRPTNAIILLGLPVLYFIVQQKTTPRLFPALKSWIIPVLVFIALLFLQLLSYKKTTGSWLVDSYPGDSFNFLQPHFFSVLFSARKGLFIYTPALLLSIAGLFFLPARKAVYAFGAFFLVNTWVISSWHDWSYGGSFGMRPFVESIPLFAIPLGFLFNSGIKWWYKGAIALVGGFFILLNLFQHYQLRNGILPFDAMTWKKYRILFFEGDRKMAWKFNDLPGILPYNVRPLRAIRRNFEYDLIPENTYGVSTKGKNLSPPNAVYLHDTIKSVPDISIFYKDLLPVKKNGYVWVKAKLGLWLTNDSCKAKMLFVITDHGKQYFRQDKAIHIPTGAWQTWEYAMRLPAPESDNSLITVYMAKSDTSTVYADDFEVSYWLEPE